MDPPTSDGQGLGIELYHARPLPASIRISVQTVSSGKVTIHEASEQQVPSSADPLISPDSSSGFSGNTRYDTSPPTGESPKSFFSKRSISGFQPTPPVARADSDISLLHKSATSSPHSQHEEFAVNQSCNSLQGIKRSRANWLAATSLGLAIYSTFFSGIFVVLAIQGPFYARHIHTNGILTAASSAFMTSVFAKTIEISFITVMVALLGQVLSRRAVSHQNRSGITLAELSMRSWVTQPGTMISRWESVRYAGVTLLGVISVVAAIMAMLYTSAATALVQPQLRFAPWETTTMQGIVRASFANPGYIEHNCNTPISAEDDPVFRNATCASLEHAAMGYHNYYAYLASWKEYARNGEVSTDMAMRPKGVAFFGDNTTVIAPWLKTDLDAERIASETRFIINNVSLVIPHTGIVAAARNPRNGIMQPEELDGLGVYDIRASVPAAVAHVLCVTLQESELTPFVQSMWKTPTGPLGVDDWPQNLHYTDPRFSYPYLNGTALDDIFGWGEVYGKGKWPPVFPMRPIAYNTILNHTDGMPWGRDSIYILGNGNGTSVDTSDAVQPDYYMCQLKVSQTPLCSTHYNASGNGASLEAVCEDPTDEMQYIRSNSLAPSGSTALALDWPNIASTWAKSLSLNSGMTNGNSSNARLLSQLMLHRPGLDATKPSTAEALAVLAACTVLESTVDAPFVPFFNYTNITSPSATFGDILDPPNGTAQYFNASIRAQQYASGSSADYQNAFHIVLMSVFLMNILALAYFLWHKDWYTDFSEPPNLFSLAVNSPPSNVLAGCCATGPRGKDYGVEWRLGQDGGRVYIRDQGAGRDGGVSKRATWGGELRFGGLV